LPARIDYKAMHTLRNQPALRKETRRNLGHSWREHLSQDFQYAVRQIWRAPGFTLTVILTLALGIGTNLAIFQLLHSVLFAQLPVAAPSQLYSLHAVKSPFDGQWFFSYPAYQRLKTSTTNSAPILARSGISEGLLQRQSESATRVKYQLVSENFFDVLGLPPASGRFFEAGDKEPSQSAWPVVLRHGFWKESFGADLSIIGKQAAINGVPVVIVGIAPDRFSGVVVGQTPDIWLPLEAQASTRFSFWFDSLGPGSGADIRAPYINQQNVYWLWLMARVPDEAKSSAVTQWTAVLQPDMALLAGASKEARDRERILASHVQLISAATGEGTLREDYAQALILLMIMAGLVLLAGCVNLANLQLSRLMSRQREFVVRTALGASRWRISRQLLVEDALLASIGAVLALAVGKLSSSLLLQYASGGGNAISLDLRMGWQLFAFGVALLLAALAAFSLLPAWRITGGHLAGAMTTRSSPSASQGKSTSRWSAILLAGQVSLSVPLLGMAGLFTQTLRSLDRVDAGLDRDHIVSVHLDFENAGYGDRDLPDLYGRMLARLKQLPGVSDAAVSMCAIPGCMWNTAIRVYGHPEIADEQVHGEENHVGAGYFHTLGISILEGREFEERDLPTSQPVAILNHAFARKLFGNESPVGHRIGYEPAPRDADYVIVGEVADARVDDLRSPAPPVAYFSIDQRPAKAGTIEVRGNGRPVALASAIRHALLSVDAHLPITEIIPLREEYDAGLSREKLLARLTGAFGFLAEVLAALGFYGLLSFSVARRTAEIGIRVAMGATPAQVRALVLRQTLGILVAGILPGIALTEAASRGARVLFYGSGAIDAWALAFAISVLGIAGMLAAWRPARRAAVIDPVEALRAE
jgi:predicted permease